MGDGKHLKEVIDAKNTNVRKVSFATGISASTLYTIIQKDSNIRYDYALRLARVLDVEPEELCTASPFSGDLKEEDVYFTIHDSLGILDNNRVSTYVKTTLLPLLKLYGPTGIIELHNLLSIFYQLDDEAREEVVESMKVNLKYHKDPTRAEEFKNLKIENLHVKKNNNNDK